MKQRTTGFTIVELLVVVGIMALLVSIVLPVYQNAMRTTRYNNCMENMRKISVALTLYRSDNGHYPAAPRAEYLQSMDLDAMPLSKAPSWTISPWAAESELDTVNKKTLKLAAVTQLVPGMAVKLIPNTEWTIKQLVDTKTVELNECADDLAKGMLAHLCDTDTGNQENVRIDAVSIDKVNNTKKVTFAQELTETYANGGTFRIDQADLAPQTQKPSDVEWNINQRVDNTTLKLTEPVNDLVAGTTVRLRDAKFMEDKVIAQVNTAANTVIFTQDMKPNAFNDGTLRAIEPITLKISAVDDVNKTISFTDALQLYYANGGSVEPVPVKITAAVAEGDDTITVESVAGLSEGMRVTLKDKQGNVGDEPIIKSFDTTDPTNQKVIFTATLRNEYAKGDTVEWTIGNFGLATLYNMFLNDEKDYLRSYQIFHCPAMKDTEQVDRSANVKSAATIFGNDNRAFDPLWAGFNTYDLTYNYDQYDALIGKYDEALNFLDKDNQIIRTNEKRQLNNAFPPANTVVCWCTGHDVARRGNATNPIPEPPAIRPDEVTTPILVSDATDDNYKEFESRFDAHNNSIVLWVDGTIRTVRPYLARSSDGKYYWVPPFLYTSGEAR